jgi:hypothetical protein
MTSLSLREGPQFKTAFLLPQKTRENAVNFPSVVHLGFCYAKSQFFRNTRKYYNFWCPENPKDFHEIKKAGESLGGPINLIPF